jgi:hypothetical protein
MKTANLNNYLNFLTEAKQRGLATTELCLKHKINTRTTSTLKKLNLLDNKSNFYLIESPSLALAKRIIKENLNTYHQRKNVGQTEIPFKPNATLNGVVYNKVTGRIRTEKLVIRLTKEEKEHLTLLSEKENKTMSKYVVEKLFLNEIGSNSTFIRKPLKDNKQANIILFWGMIKIKR